MALPINFFSCLIFLFLTFATNGQEELGLKLDNFSSPVGLHLNPTSMHNGVMTWSADLGGGAFFMHTNYAHMNNANLFSVNSRLREIQRLDEADQLTTEKADEILNYSYDQYDRDSYVNTNFQIYGPSFWMRAGDYSIGLTTALKGGLSVSNAPYKEQIDIWNNQPDGTDFTLEKMDATGLTWTEIGLNFVKNFEFDFEVPINAGINVKYLSAADAVYAVNLKETGAAKYFDSLYINASDFEVGLFGGYQYDTSTNVAAYNFDPSGWGMSTDIGATYYWGDGSLAGYGWRVSASVIDIGRLKYTNGDLHTFSLQDGFIDGGAISNENPDFEVGKEGLDIQDIIYDVRAGEYSFWLPAAFVAQVDYAMTENFAFNATVVRRIPLKTTFKRTNVLAITPRYESKWISASLPLSLINDRRPMVGANVRLGPLTIGSENLASVFLPGNFRGTDFYMGLQINSSFFTRGNRGFSGFGSRGGGTPNTRVRCFQF